jgi:hypothetical protein
MKHGKKYSHVRHFKTKEAYRKFKAYVHIHGIKTRKHEYVIIGGHIHKIKHRR